ncbi:MAG: hypothetical protein HRU33_14025 [Rhodobacteraceae bacterium]|nr:hypothetical protein [Paracoccaceae bacterium]
MADRDIRLGRDHGKWRIVVRSGVEGAASGAWLSLGGSTCQITALRVWLACLTLGKR